MQTKILNGVVGAIACVGMAGVASAGTVQVVSSLADMDGATSATGALPYRSGGSNSFTVGDVTYTTASQEMYLQEWTTGIAGNELAISDVENFDLGLADSVRAIGFYYYEPSSAAGANVPSPSDSTFDVTFTLGGAAVGSSSFNGEDNQLDFIGFRTDFAFDGLQIRERGGNNDNEFFGEIYTSNVGIVPTPGAAAAGLVLLGGLGLRRRS